MDVVPLHIKFPRLFALAREKIVVVRDCGAFANGSWTWNFNLRRQLFGWELELLHSLLAKVNGVIPCDEGDKIVCAGDSS